MKSEKKYILMRDVHKKSCAACALLHMSWSACQAALTKSGQPSCTDRYDEDLRSSRIAFEDSPEGLAAYAVYLLEGSG